MRRPRRALRSLLSCITVTGLSAGLVALGGGGAFGADAAPSRPAAPLPAHLAAPYFEAWTGESPATLAAESGNKYLTMAFLQTDAAGSCTAYWNGDTSQPISKSAASSFGADIAAIQARGGNVIPSFGGYGADTTGTELADSCTSVDAIAKVYESLVTTYGISRIDLDIEADSINNTAGIDRRNKAIAQVQRWAERTGRRVQFSYTLPTTTTGLAPNGVALLKNAVDNHARVDVVNIMTFDYWDGATHDMAADTETAGDGLVGQLASLYPKKSRAQLWRMVGVTEMPGIDDFGPQETFTTQDAVKVEQWAEAKGINTLSFWALQRDNGGCVGTSGSNSCSGIAQDTWYFSHAFERFTRW
ncbi:chitinase [Streptomyces sp. TLI_185]|uniref:chitinase n=1 Tax=Streptomyces sp. TLI_185 TaxID=2485151 RepID=UPI000F4D7527|nr:chitinase [Streptomyces sp. TLI_185]RPF34966.1 glycosyl hydrolase family 18 (putative chitinase) [Streptomyces sp. TLI_185]